MLNVRAERIENIPLLVAEGRLDGAGAGSLDAAAAPFRQGIEGPVAVDLSAVVYLSSAGLRSLIVLAKACAKRQARVMLIGLQTPVRQVLEMAGLAGQFDLAVGRDEAARLLREKSATHARTTVITHGGRGHHVTPIPGSGSTLERWRPDIGAPLVCLALDELGVAIGRGGLGNTSAQAAEAVGPLMATGRLVCVRPPGGTDDAPDFIVTDRPAEVPVYVAEAWTLRGSPAAFVTADAGESTVAGMVESFEASLRQTAGRVPECSGWVVAATDPGRPGGGWVGVGCRPAGGAWQMEAVRVDDLAMTADATDAGAYLREALRTDTLAGAFTPAPERRVGRYLAWLYAAAGPRDAVRRTHLAFEDVAEPPEEWDWIARRIYADAGRVSMRRLCGGFSAATFHVESFDADGRRLLPTVLKLADPAFSEREDHAYDLYVSRYILNNSAVRMGRCARNGWVGLRYNFLGITGPESRLQWIGGRFTERPLDETLPLFRELFGRILAPWYAQARPAPVAPYREHDPRRLFPTLVGEAAAVLGIGPEQPFIACPPLGRELPNPYAVLDRVYAARANAEWPGMSSIVHGDLNLNNVLIDERENLFVIDFSETRMGDLGGDFARIEPLLVLQMTRLRDEADLASLLRYVESVVQPDSLFDLPETCAGDDPFLPKAHALIRLLRSEVQRLSGGRQHAVPYLLGLLRWTLPIVVFRQMPMLYKQASCYASALLAEALLKADPEAAAHLKS